MLCLELRHLEAEVLSGAFLPSQEAVGVKVWMQVCRFSFRNQTEFPFSVLGLGGNR